MNKNSSISWNATVALSLLGANLVVGLYDLASHGGKNVTEHSPQWLRDLEFPIFGVATPLILLGMGFIVAYAIRGNRRAYLGVAALGILLIVMNIEPTVTRMEMHGIEHAFVCLVNAAGGLLTALYAFRAYREPSQDTTPPAPAQPSTNGDPGVVHTGRTA